METGAYLSNLKMEVKTHAIRGQQASHIIGGRSSSSSQKGFFRGCSFISPFLSSTFSLTLSSTICFSNFTSSLKVGAVVGPGGGVTDGEEKGSVTSVTEALGITISPFCLPSSSSFSCLSFSPTLFLCRGLEGRVWGSVATVTMLSKTTIHDKKPRLPGHPNEWEKIETF